MEEPRKNAASLVHSIYYPGFAYPSWVLDPTIWVTHRFQDTKVFYTVSDSFQDVLKLLKEREPCNIGMKRLYNEVTLQEKFGYNQGAYGLSTNEKRMPNIAVYTHATARLQNRYVNIHVINLIGAALDHPSQPDFQYFREKPVSVLIEFYRSMWCLALAAMIKSPCTTLQIYNVGGGAFAGPHGEFVRDVFEPAFRPLLPLFEKRGYKVTGYDWASHTFNGGFIPDCLEEGDHATTMYVNAWDPWTLIGNGNERDRSLDGYWGRISNMAVLGWLPTNPHMRFLPVELPKLTNEATCGTEIRSVPEHTHTVVR